LTGLSIAKVRFDPYDVYDLGYQGLFDDIVTATINNALIDGSRTFFVVGEVAWKSAPNIDIFKKFAFVEDIKELGGEGNRYTYMARGSNLPFYSELIETMTSEFYCFFEYPLVYASEGVYVQVCGERENLKRFFDFVTGLGITFELIHMKEYHIKGPALLAELTDKQYQCTKLAIEKGYFDIPRKSDLRALAKQMNVSHGTLAFHLRKAQRSMLHALFR